MQHPVQRFLFDKAVWMFGITLDADLAEAEKSKTKKPKSEKQIAMAKQTVMTRWLGTQAVGFRAPPPGQIKTQ